MPTTAYKNNLTGALVSRPVPEIDDDQIDQLLTVRPAGDYTIPETQQELNCARGTVYNLLNAEELTSYAIGKLRRITRESIARYKQRNLVTLRKGA